MSAQVDAGENNEPLTAEDELYDLSWGVERSIRYHEMRQSFFERADRFFNAITAITGSSAVIALVKTNDPGGLVGALSALVAIAGVINLTMKSSTMASKHAELKQRFVTLLIAMKNVDFTASNVDKQIRKLQIERLMIEKDEPAICRLVDVMAHNEIARAKGYDEQWVWFIPFWQRITAHLRRGNVTFLKTVAQMQGTPQRAT